MNIWPFNRPKKITREDEVEMLYDELSWALRREYHALFIGPQMDRVVQKILDAGWKYRPPKS